MRIWLHIGPEAMTSERVQRVFEAKRKQLAKKGVLYPRSAGTRNHVRLFMAATHPDRPDPLRFARGLASAEAQTRLREQLIEGIEREIAREKPEVMVLSAHQLAGGLLQEAELGSLYEMLRPLSDDIRPIALWDDPARMGLRHYVTQLSEGRSLGIEAELALLNETDYAASALEKAPKHAPEAGVFETVECPTFWLDAQALEARWNAVFGDQALRFFSVSDTVLYGEDLPRHLRRVFELPENFGRSQDEPPRPLPPSAWLTRLRRFNGVMQRLQAQEGLSVPRLLRNRFGQEMAIEGEPPQSGALGAISTRFAPDLAMLCERHPFLDPRDLVPDPAAPAWQEADPLNGFRETQYLAAFLPRLRAAQEDEEVEHIDLKSTQDRLDEATAALTPYAQTHMPHSAVAKFAQLRTSAFAPHDDLGLPPGPGLPFPPAEPRAKGAAPRLIVACMKNEAPYILEWVAYHQALGFDQFLIYTNDCDDSTARMLDRLQELGVVQHRDNSDWSGASPQQHALDKALAEPLVRRAEWIAHIDVDEFINIRCGDGSLQALFNAMPQATHIAMTWRLFGHDGQHSIQDKPVIQQFTRGAPRFCPKPHTAWGFKTLFRNQGAYESMSCHRPNGLASGARVQWANGSGRDITGEYRKAGWRSSKRSIGYDLVQLNHYALRSAESFLIKRARGRALHVDRKIGLNYWLRMDWSDFEDLSIQRHLPRTLAALAPLRRDSALAKLHEEGLAWHRDKAKSLRAQPDFADLYERALELRLDPVERAAWALSLDMES